MKHELTKISQIVNIQCKFAKVLTVLKSYNLF